MTMNPEARKKYCNLLMFDVQKPNCGGLDNHSFTIDYTTSLENNNNIGINDNFIFTSFVEPMRVRPQTPIRNAIANSEVETREEKDESKMKKPSDTKRRTPRPPNAFILYRKAKQSEVTADRGNISNAMISKILSRLWRDEKEDVKLYWRKLADKKKVEHMEAHPEYVYRPKKAKINNIKKRRKSDPIESNSSTPTTITATTPTTTNIEHFQIHSSPQLTEIYSITSAESLPLSNNGFYNDFLWNSHAPQYNESIPIEIQHDGMQNVYENFHPNTDETYPFYYQPYYDMFGSYI